MSISPVSLILTLARDDAGEGRFDDDGSGGAGKPSGTATPTAAAAADDATATASGAKRRKGVSKKAKSMREKLAIADGGA